MAAFAVYIVVVMVISIPLIYNVKSYEGKNLVDTTKDKHYIQSQLMIHNLVDVCFAHKDETTGRTYPGVIDPKKFTDETLKKCSKGQDVYLSLPETKAKDAPITKISTGESLDRDKYAQRHVMYKNNLVLMRMQYA